MRCHHSVLRDMVRKVIERHITPRALKTLRAAEANERSILKMWARELPEE